MTQKRNPAELIHERDEYDDLRPIELLQSTAADMVRRAIKNADVHGFQTGYKRGTKHGLSMAASLIRGTSPEEQEEMWRSLATHYEFNLEPLAPEAPNG